MLENCDVTEKIIVCIAAKAGVARKDGLMFTASALRDIAEKYPETFSFRNGELLVLDTLIEGECWQCHRGFRTTAGSYSAENPYDGRCPSCRCYGIVMT